MCIDFRTGYYSFRKALRMPIFLILGYVKMSSHFSNVTGQSKSIHHSLYSKRPLPEVRRLHSWPQSTKKTPTL